MRRRELVGCAAAAMLQVPGIRILGNESRWEPDGIGSVARLGVLTPDFDPVPESEMSAMAPLGISIHGARVARRGAARSFAEAPQIDTATEQLAGLKPLAVLFAFTSSSYAIEPERMQPFERAWRRTRMAPPSYSPAKRRSKPFGSWAAAGSHSFTPLGSVSRQTSKAWSTSAGRVSTC
jgi:hypothetical protein